MRVYNCVNPVQGFSPTVFESVSGALTTPSPCARNVIPTVIAGIIGER
jgi:hypothetical protein